MSYLLCVDDDEAICLLTSTILSRAGFEVATGCDGASALRAIAQREPDLIVLDIDMPHMSGLEVCRRVKSNPFTARIPVLMLTAQSDIERKVEGFDAGADDYLAKPFHPRELQARVEALLRLVRRESDRNPTSGLPGGRAIREEIERRAARAASTGERFAICYIDLDHFKPFADTFGFDVADVIIAKTGAAICDAILAVAERGIDSGAGRGAEHFAGHIGGDDFIVVTDENEAEEIARECAAGFHSVVSEVLGETTVANGHFTGVDREGRAREFPIASLTTAILVVDPARWVSTAHLGAFAAEVKRNAKSQGAGSIILMAA
ncbi:MAG TPA: response regulator [Abditibacteriaceae bacterium]